MAGREEGGRGGGRGEWSTSFFVIFLCVIVVRVKQCHALLLIHLLLQR